MTKKELYLTIHNCLHSQVSHAFIEGETYEIQVSNSKLPFIRYKDTLFIKQNSTSGVFGRLVVENRKITLIVRTGNKWGVIIDQEIYDQQNGE